MKTALSYLKTRVRAIACALLFIAICSLVFVLYSLPVFAVGYALLISLCVFLAIAIVDYFAFRRKLLALALLVKQPLNVENRLPPARGDVERQYQALVRRMDACSFEICARMEREGCDRSEYYAVWAHQIKTPIAGMRLLLQSDDPLDVPALSEALAGIEHYVEMAMAYQRVESPTSDYLIREYELDGIVAQALKKFSYQFIHKHIRLNYQPLNARVLTDRKWLSFIIEQVLSNALKYTPSGEISVRLNNEGALIIRDTGIGIAPEDLPRVFEKGYTGFNGRLDGKASGIGLNLCKRVAGRLGHTISIESALGRGTTVTLSLKRSEFVPE